MHPILKRQLEHAFGNLTAIPKNWQDFLNAVSQTYSHFDEDRELLDRSLSISSKEFAENSQKLREAKTKVEEIVRQRTLELQQEKARLLASINSLTFGFAIFDASGNIFNSNEILAQILKLKSLTSISNISKQIGKDIKLQDIFNQVIKNKKALDIKNVQLGKKFLRVFMAPIFLGTSTETIGSVLIVEDTTKEQEIERAKSEFIILASHQLRTPLTIIKWNADLLEKKVKLSPALKKHTKYVKAILEGSGQMSELIEDLLNVTRLEANKFPIIPEMVNLKDVCKNTIKELKNEIKEKSLNLTENYSNNLPQIKTDPNAIILIIKNLLTNSIKYTPEQGCIDLNLNFEQATNSIAISVADTGYGIPQEEQPKIFTKLFRADNIKLIKASGTGLGLYITKSVVSLLGGKIWFKSPTASENSGTTFFVSIPVKNGSAN